VQSRPHYLFTVSIHQDKITAKFVPAANELEDMTSVDVEY
jgi:hypothetical protein